MMTASQTEDLLTDALAWAEDADTLAKLILDAANGIWYEDDRQVVFLAAQKVEA